MPERVIEHILPPPQQQHGQQCHHRHKTNQQTSAADDAHLLYAFEIGQRHGQKRAGGRKAAGENPLARINHRLAKSLLLGLALAQFLLVTRDQVHAKIDRQSDEHWQKCDGENIQVPDHQRRKRHRIGQTNHQTKGRLDRPPRLVVTVDEDERDENQGHDRGHGGVVLRLGHFIIFQHRFAGDAYVDSRHLDFCLPDQFAQPLHRLVVQIIASGAGRHDVNAPVRKRDIELLFGFFAGIEQGRQAGRRRGAGSLQTVGSLRDDPFHRGQRFRQRFVLRIFFALGGEELVVDQAK